MDSAQFNAIVRSLFATIPRRRVLSTLGARALTPLGLSALDTPEQTRAKRRKKRKKRKEDAPCDPDCNGRDCGEDGCGGTCGPCMGGTCQDGVCACPEDKCGGACVAYCPALIGHVRNPATCECCLATETVFGNRHTPYGECRPCCSSRCGPQLCGLFSGNLCYGRDAGEGCEFDAQCESDECQDSGPGVGTCA